MHAGDLVSGHNAVQHPAESLDLRQRGQGSPSTAPPSHHVGRQRPQQHNRTARTEKANKGEAVSHWRAAGEGRIAGAVGCQAGKDHVDSQMTMGRTTCIADCTMGQSGIL
jgi:hypothetical protein